MQCESKRGMTHGFQRFQNGEKGALHCIKNVHIRSFSGLNAGKCGPVKLRIRTLFMKLSLVTKKYDGVESMSYVLETLTQEKNDWKIGKINRKEKYNHFA